MRQWSREKIDETLRNVTAEKSTKLYIIHKITLTNLFFC